MVWMPGSCWNGPYSNSGIVQNLDPHCIHMCPVFRCPVFKWSLCNENLKVSKKNDHLKTGQSGFRMLTVKNSLVPVHWTSKYLFQLVLGIQIPADHLKTGQICPILLGYTVLLHKMKYFFCIKQSRLAENLKTGPEIGWFKNWTQICLVLRCSLCFDVHCMY
jgi:hypothetical protein